MLQQWANSCLPGSECFRTFFRRTVRRNEFDIDVRWLTRQQRRRRSTRSARRRKNATWYPRVNPLSAIDHLGHCKISRDAHQRIGVVARNPLQIGQQAQHFEGRRSHRLVQILVEAVNDPMLRRLKQRRREGKIPPHKYLQQNIEGRFDGSSTYLAIALGNVWVAHRESAPSTATG